MANLIGQSLGRYHIFEQLGEGGMATVYKAYDTRLETDVAVKVIRTEKLTEETRERSLKRFEREAKSLARLTHPNIVKVTDYGEYEGKPFLVMPYLPGGTLKSKLSGKPMPWQEAIRLLIPIADALGYAHKHDVIHRDIKPSNILITENGQPMLSDFGVAKLLDAEETMELTGTGVGVGTPEYMAPEQGSSKTVDHRADIYALGVVFYEMVTGRKPFIADTPLAVLIKRASEPLPRPKQFVPDLPQAVENVLFKALAKEPKDRYQNMGEFTIALEGLVAGKARTIKEVKPEPPKSMHPSHLRSSRFPWAWIGVTAICILGLVGLLSIGGKLSTLLFSISRSNQSPSSTFIVTPSQISKPLITSTSTPSLTPSLAIVHVESVDGTGGSVRLSDSIMSGQLISVFKGGGVMLTIPASNSDAPPGVLYLFEDSSAIINFNGKLKPELARGAIYIQPGGVDVGEIHFGVTDNIFATISGSRMILERKGNDIWLYCFEGTCEYHMGSQITSIPLGFKMAYRLSSEKLDPGSLALMSYDERWEWNRKCNFCMWQIIPTPTPH